MGVFDRLLRRSKTTEEASTAEAQAGTPTAEPAAEETAAKAKGSAEAEERTEVEPAEPETDEAASGEGVEIPQQQSAEKAADSEAGEDAHR
ncbi:MULTISPECIES: hypothetical protein [unclassified Streptomyces]|uniref:hypothetical protein n=1 Tax=unclassified Streptomyces TaxID=2593676 RepID=UPI00224F41C1|nr:MULTISPECIES: hypothetical protein [unclassified Streptomyces]MCX4883996.1 hypothetical protein [Streptomyces sp. NBC_00847]MCX5424104.1 hypothetical protein [Streptomyces sp. NBC_00078]